MSGGKAGMVEAICEAVAAYRAGDWQVIAIMAAPNIAAQLGESFIGVPVQERAEWSWGWAPRLAAKPIEAQP